MLFGRKTAASARFSCSSRKACFTRRWQSSNVPANRQRPDIAAPAVSWRSCVGDTSPLGNSTATSTPGRSWKAAATAPPVSPEVATRMVSTRSPAAAQTREAGREEAGAEILVTPRSDRWNSSSTESLPAPAEHQRSWKVERFGGDRAQQRRERIAATKGARRRTATLARSFASKSDGASRGQLTGTGTARRRRQA